MVVASVGTGSPKNHRLPLYAYTYAFLWRTSLLPPKISYGKACYHGLASPLGTRREHVKRIELV